jgi:hypothetical protein
VSSTILGFFQLGNIKKNTHVGDGNGQPSYVIVFEVQ